MRNILFVIDRDFASNSAVHVSALANELCLLGMDCAVAVPGNKQSIAQCGDVLYQALEFSEASRVNERFANGKGPDAVHSWTPREIVRKFCVGLRQEFEFKQFIHLEDNEELLIEKLRAIPGESDESGYPQQLSHPVRYREFLASADGVTVIIEKLKEFVPNGTSSLTLWPGVETSTFYPRPATEELKRRFAVPLNVTVIVYTGNVHQANAGEVRSLYLAVAMLNREGIPTCLIRTGTNHCDFLTDAGSWIKPHVRELGFVERSQMPDVLALADIFVQPGRPDRFNEYRFPSKLPEFLAMGKPVILPNSNLGAALLHEQQALVFDHVDGVQITDAVKQLCQDQTLYSRLSAGALEFAQTQLSWPRQAARLLEFYRSA